MSRREVIISDAVVRNMFLADTEEKLENIRAESANISRRAALNPNLQRQVSLSISILISISIIIGDTIMLIRDINNDNK